MQDTSIRSALLALHNRYDAPICTDWEALCVDDGSTDATPGSVASFARTDNRIAVGWGEVICFCDAGGIWSARKLLELDAAFADPYVHNACGRIAFIRNPPSNASVFSTVPRESYAARGQFCLHDVECNCPRKRVFGVRRL